MPLGIPRHRPNAAKTPRPQVGPALPPPPLEQGLTPTAAPPSTPPGIPPSWQDRVVRSLHFSTYHVLFPVTIFLSAFLLFQLQPMMGRYILPWFGGGPAVWTGCLLFFQTCLLAGYAYAHWRGCSFN